MRKVLITTVLVFGLAFSGMAYADDASSAAGFGWSGRGHGSHGRHDGARFAQNEEIQALREQLAEKRLEMAEIFRSDQFDQARAQTVQQEMNDLRDRISEAVLASMIEFRTENPDWRPGGRNGGFRPMDQFNQSEEVVDLRNQLDQKRKEIRELFQAQELDEAGIRALHQEIKDLQDRLSDMRLEFMLEFRQNNPDWQPGAAGGRANLWSTDSNKVQNG